MRKISVPIYAASLAVTLIIFAVGVYVGTILDKGNLETVQSQIEKTNQLVLSSQIMLLFGESRSFCPVYAEQLGKLDAETEQVGLKLTYLEDMKGVTDAELKKQYFALETNAFLLSEKVREKCGGNFTTILYFYSNKGCADCGQQGYELINLKQKMGWRVRIYSFDGELGSSVADALKTEYSVRNYPTIVIGNKTLFGFKTTREIEMEIG